MPKYEVEATFSFVKTYTIDAPSELVAQCFQPSAAFLGPDYYFEEITAIKEAQS